jgi:sulfotransferase family protein
MPLTQFGLNWIALESMKNAEHRKLVFSRPFAFRRKFQAFGVSMPRCGTTSLTRIFGRYRAVHEQAKYACKLIYIDSFSRDITRERQIATLKFIDAVLYPEMSSGGHLGFLIDAVVEAFPRAKYVLTIRNPYHWLQKTIRLSIKKRDNQRPISAMGYLQYKPHLYPYTPHDQTLRQNGILSLDSLLSFWADYNQRIIDTVPADRLLAFRLDELSSADQRLADFLEIDRQTLVMDKSHVNKSNLTGDSPFDEIDRDYMDERVRHFGGSLMDRFFQDIKKHADSFSRA